MKKKTVLFPIEIKARELNSKILLSLQCAKRGMRAYIGSKTSINRLYPKLESGIFFYKSGDRVERIENIKKYCSHFIVMDEEVGPAIPNEFICQTLKNRMREGAIPLIDKFFLIGDNYKECAQKVYSKSEKDVIASGWPRIDLWRPEFLSIYYKKTKEIKSNYGDYILLSSNFGVTSERSLELWKKHVDDNIGWDKDYKDFFKKNIISKFNAFLSYIKLLQKISKKLKDIRIIVRPHPADDQNGWYEGIGELENIEVIYKGEISPWLYASKGLLHYGCTTSVQAGIGGIPSLVYKPPKDELGNTAAFKVSKMANNINDVIRFFKKLDNYNKSQIQADSLKKIGSLINSIKGEIASSKIAKILSKFESKKIDSVQFSKRDLAYLEARNIGYKGLLLKSKLIGNNEISPRAQKIPGYIETSDIKEVVDLIAAKIELNAEEVKLKKIARNLFEIECC